ncbi:hypothetical protein STRAU_4760 [Streptomyces aurantiacus JA 4570]|uniref:Uncharacterized protein n=1 Tax=Streptomyces aurantiacus JA 4570 TaxID=1286094 RepID=S3ZUV7_9ACTN|nr:hypothetical protein STRAU_4760 [Streptomyces aurantiacus JA 4570]
MELEAYDRPGFADRLQTAGRGAEATESPWPRVGRPPPAPSKAPAGI